MDWILTARGPSLGRQRTAGLATGSDVRATLGLRLRGYNTNVIITANTTIIRINARVGLLNAFCSGGAISGLSSLQLCVFHE